MVWIAKENFGHVKTIMWMVQTFRKPKSLLIMHGGFKIRWHPCVGGGIQSVLTTQPVEGCGHKFGSLSNHFWNSLIWYYGRTSPTVRGVSLNLFVGSSYLQKITDYHEELDAQREIMKMIEDQMVLHESYHKEAPPQNRAMWVNSVCM